tara:strand:- start:2214 stop:5189 length:2976 start_codon:yes stop_codon:yes gene_type:complete
MPKQTLKIEGFHGGLNTNADPRDVADFQSPDLFDIGIDSLGRLKLLGTSTASDTNNTLLILPNRGLFVLDADRKVSDNAESNESLIIVYDVAGDSFDVNDSGGWSTAEISLDTSHPVFYAADGILRIGDGALAENGKWYGYIGETKFASLRPAQVDADWISLDQNISTPTSGRCLVSNSNLGSDGNTINSLSKEYDGNVTDNSSSSRVVEHSSVNLRVGFPFKNQIQNTQTAWEINSGSPSNCTLSEPAETTIYPSTSNNVILATGTTGYFHRIILDKSDSGVDFNFNLSNNQSLMLGLNISEAELNALDYMFITLGTGTGGGESVSYRFDASELIHSYLNILVCSNTNVSSFGGNADLDNDIEYIMITAYQPSTSSGTHSPDIYYHMPMVVENPSLQGFQPGEYQFHHTFLYDDSKQESLPFTFNDVGNTFHANKVNILGSSILLDFDAYILPFNFISCAIDVSDHQIDKSNHGLSIGTKVSFSGATNANWLDKNDSIFFVSSQSLETNSFRISTTFSNAVSGTSIDFTGSDDTSGVAYYIYNFNKRIIGSRLYYTEKENDNYFLIGELDFIEKGFKFFPESDTFNYDIVNTSHTDNLLYKSVIAKDISPDSANTIDTFKTINGFSTEIKSLDAKYKTAVVHGRRIYIGNISKDGKKHSDRMLKSRVNKFDTFPSNMGVVDVAIRDGESIVKLEAFADRILQFKQKSLYVINVSENIDFLEDVYRNKGCAFDYHVTKTDYGIAWFNKFGVYFYDGKNVINLLEKDGIRLIGESDWESFITDSDTDMSEAHIGYVPKKRHLLIKDRSKRVFIYDFVLKAWTKGANRINVLSSGNNDVHTNMTNFALNENEDLIFITNDSSWIATWNPVPADSGNFLYTTKDIDFGQPSVRKKIYKVYVTYKSGNATTNVMVDYDINGGTTFPYDFKNGTNFSSNKLNAANGWQEAELVPDVSSESDSINSFRLRFQMNTSSVPAGFEINDITIVYRLKNIK